MKKEELNFKVLTGTLCRCQQIINALLDKEFLEAKDIRVDNKVIFCDRGNLACSFQPEAIEGRMYLPEVTFRQALELIWKVEPEHQVEGEFVEFEVDEKGMFHLTTPEGIFFHWQRVLEVADLSQGLLTFAGWIFVEKNGDRKCSITPRGYDLDGDLIVTSDAWVKPAQPAAVRFWRKNKC